MAERTFGWVQESYNVDSLKRCLEVFIPHSEIYDDLINDKIPRLIPEKYGKSKFLKELNAPYISIPYTDLKGKGNVDGSTRKTAPCTGIFQAAVKGQRKEYISDWPADSFARWAISLGLLNYNRKNDCCSITPLGIDFVEAPDKTNAQEETYLQAFGSNPPVVRVLQLLKDSNRKLTKFELGKNLGFKTEAGFTSVDIRDVAELILANPGDRNKILSNIEGTSDKYARTICTWLKKIGWVRQCNDNFVVVDTYLGKKTLNVPQSYEITANGKAALRRIQGLSSHSKIPKRVFWEMLSSKPADRNYIRNRRSYIIKFLNLGTYHTVEEIQNYLTSKSISEPAEVILEDLNGLKNLGLTVQRSLKGFKIMDSIVGLEIPEDSIHATACDLSIVKNELRAKLKYVNHDYLTLIDYAWDPDSNRAFEFKTAEFLREELGLKGKRLGDSRKPDVCVYYSANGLIIDNKAYGKGYSLPIKQADEMIRYLDENQKRNEKLNSNKWWEIFPDSVNQFGFSFVSSDFKGSYLNQLKYISERTGYNGSCITAKNLLLIGEKLKAKEISYDDFFTILESNHEVLA